MVARRGQQVLTQNTFTPGDVLSIAMDSMDPGQEQIRASGGVSGCVNNEALQLNTAGSSGDIVVWAGHARNSNGIAVTDKLVLRMATANAPPPPSPPPPPPPPSP
eukprot:CAMPEP_0119302828 /NCGR_PEP_ID=MMETSP1333-20130426/4361_1 /TAXON_ID=418940 /ORGANISM="Scyphosphaera apsteinii, Strain RCC1455" /LENGTH=104 /DNA_ID=CAMNT_0007305305 /DNA_START=204 /DNA_END=514 /DNA_ORIENTATION=+